MIEVIPNGNGFSWQWIAACGRVLWSSADHFPCNKSAWAAANRVRQAFWGQAQFVDHRQARCV